MSDHTSVEPERQPFVVLCYGDQNTWGQIPGRNTRRYSIDSRWPGVMRAELGDGYHIIEDGLPGRTTVWEDPIDGDKNGKRHLAVSLASHRPVDLVIIMLGVNDLKDRFGHSTATVSASVHKLGDMVLQSEAWAGAGSPQLLLVAPPALGNGPGLPTDLAQGLKTSQELGASLGAVATVLGCAFIDANDVAQVSDLDQLHLNSDGHQELGTTIALAARSLLQP